MVELSLIIFLELEYAVKFRKPILVVRDCKTKVPEIPDNWKMFTNVFSARIQQFSVFYLTEFASKLKQVRLEFERGDSPHCLLKPTDSGAFSLKNRLTFRLSNYLRSKIEIS